MTYYQNQIDIIWEEKTTRLKEKIEIKSMDILLYNNDSINSQGDLALKIKEESNEADKKLLENIDMNNHQSRKIRNNWSGIDTDRRKKLKEKNQKYKLYIFDI